MPSAPSTIKAQLEQEIQRLQGYKPPSGNNGAIIDCGPMAAAFPNAVFPLGGIHEFLSGDASGAAATTGFIAGILSFLLRKGGAAIWISTAQKIFPPGLKQFGLDPDRIIFIEVKKDKEALWVMEESLHYSGLVAVVGEINAIDLTASRRLQLAVEQSCVTGFIIRAGNRSLNTIACVARWHILSSASKGADGLPGVSFPRWQIGLLKVRNGRPGNWLAEWRSGRFFFISPNKLASLPAQQRKTG